MEKCNFNFVIYVMNGCSSGRLSVPSGALWFLSDWFLVASCEGER